MKKNAILCVDDEAIQLFALVQELKNEFGDTFLYEKAMDANKALVIIEELVTEGITVILIISDWLMPGMKGDEFLEIVSHKYPDIKAVMITGHADEDALKKLRSNPSVLCVLTKPWDAKELQTIISTCLSENEKRISGG